MLRFRLGSATLAIGLVMTTVPAVAAENAARPSKRPAHHRASSTPLAMPTTAATPTTGNASFYAHRFAGRKTASGDRYDPAALTAAHRTLPMGTRLKVVNPKNDQSVIVTVNDRGPKHGNRMLDVSSAAADQLGMRKSGVTRVHTEVVHHDADHRPDGPATPSSSPDDHASR